MERKKLDHVKPPFSYKVGFNIRSWLNKTCSSLSNLLSAHYFICQNLRFLSLCCLWKPCTPRRNIYFPSSLKPWVLRTFLDKYLSFENYHFTWFWLFWPLAFTYVYRIIKSENPLWKSGVVIFFVDRASLKISHPVCAFNSL